MKYDNIAVLIPAYKPDRRLNKLVEALNDAGFRRVAEQHEYALAAVGIEYPAERPLGHEALHLPVGRGYRHAFAAPCLERAEGVWRAHLGGARPERQLPPVHGDAPAALGQGGAGDNGGKRRTERCVLLCTLIDGTEVPR